MKAVVLAAALAAGSAALVAASEGTELRLQCFKAVKLDWFALRAHRSACVRSSGPIYCRSTRNVPMRYHIILEVCFIAFVECFVWYARCLDG